jgi:hypothetical protein
MYDYGTDNFLRNEIANAERFRTELDNKLAGYRTNVAACEAKIAALDTRITDLNRLLDFHTLRNGDELAHAFANAVLDRDGEMRDAREDIAPKQAETGHGFSIGDLVNVSDPDHKHFGVRGSVIGFAYGPDEVVVEYDNLGSSLYMAPAQLMHHTEFVKQSDEFFESAEQQAAKDAEAADDAMSASERFEHDQADEAKLDAEGWGQGGAPF